MHSRVVPWVVLLVAALAVVGCGGKSSSDKDKVKATYDRLVKEIGEHDGTAACALFTPQGRLEFERYQNQGSGEPPLRCDALLKDLAVPGERLIDLKVTGDKATADLRDEGGQRLEQAVAFAKVNGRWLVDKFGPFAP